MPFLRLTRDRRGFEHTYLLHADRPGEKPRILYWYRTAPDVLIGRPALDEDAIRHIEDQHPHIEFDWPAILALREAMPPEEEEPIVRAPVVRRERRGGRREQGGRPSAPPSPPRDRQATPAPADQAEWSPSADTTDAGDVVPTPEPARLTTRGLLEELVGREIATRLRARHAETMARIHERHFDELTLAAWVARADALDPDTWLTPDAILDGVRDADRRFETLRDALLAEP
ncbi:MAG: hypothetical protein IT178_17125 [Acidobacteria bacterium]|nr:hypothetical protein [Acidobacteriota bacterium]